MKKRYATALLLSCTMFQAHAINIAQTKSQYEPGGVRYEFTVTEWEPSSSSIMNPCTSYNIKNTICTVYLVSYRAPGQGIASIAYAGWDTQLGGDESWGGLLSKLNQKGFHIPFSGSLLVDTQDITPTLCISFAYAQSGPSVAGFVLPFGPCVPVNPPALQCDITGDSVIDHKSLMDNAVDGATASVQLNLQCKGATSVTIATPKADASGVRLREDGSLYSRILVNGKSATGGVSISTKEGLTSPFTVTSVLVAAGNVTPGKFHGSTVLTVSPP